MRNGIRLLLSLASAICAATLTNVADEYNWQPVDGPDGGICRDIVVRGDDALSFTNGGLFYSANRGEDWQRLQAMNAAQINGMLILPDRTFLFALGGGSLVGVNTMRDEASEIYRFADEEILSLFEHKGTLYVGTHQDSLRHIWRSTSLGRDWERVFTAQSPSADRRMSFTVSGSMIVAAFGTRIVYSSDTGLNWTASAFTAEQRIYSLASQGEILYATLASGQLLYSSDGARSWEAVDTGDFDEYFRILIADETALYAVTYLPELNRVALHTSIDEGRHWQIISEGLAGEVRSFVLDQGDLFVAGSVGVFQLSGDGAEWLSRNSGIKASHFNCFTRAENMLWVGAATGVLQSSDDGRSWRNIGLVGQIIRSMAVFKDRLYAVTDSGVYRFDDHTDEWEFLILKGISSNFLYLNPGGDRMYLGMGSAWLAVEHRILYTDDGQDWQILTREGMENDFLSSVNSLVHAGSRLFAATDDGLFSLDEGNADSWRLHPVKGSAIFEKLLLRSDTLYLSTFDKKVLYSYDMGETWTALDSVPQYQQFAYTQQLAIIDDRFYLAASDGLFSCDGPGRPWRSAGLDSTHVRAFVAGNGSIVVGTGVQNSGPLPMGLYRSDLRTTAVVGRSNTTRSNLRVEPNPASEKTRFILPSACHGKAMLEVFSSDGALIERSTVEAAGDLGFEYETSHLASGRYFVRISARDCSVSAILQVIR